MCVSVLAFSSLCSFGTVRRVSTSGLQSAELQLMLDHCRTNSHSVSLWLVSQDFLFVFLKLLTCFLLYVQVSWGGESSETFCKYFWKSCGRFFCIWRIRPGAADYTAVDVTFLTVFFSLTIFSCKKFPVSAKKVQLFSPASLLSGKT